MLNYRIKIFAYRRFYRFPRLSIWTFVSLILFSGVLYFVHYFYYGEGTGTFGEWIRDNYHLVDLSNNYFHSSAKFSTRKFLVKTDKCQIPDLDFLDPSVIPFLKKLPQTECDQIQIKLTYVKDQSLIINEDEVTRLGYQNFDDISCCYRAIYRIEQSDHHFDKDADNRVRYSKKCYPMKRITQPHWGFVVVICKANSTLWNKTIYKHFHAIAKFPNETDSSNLSRKLSFWRKCTYKKVNISRNNVDSYCESVRENGRPPNVLIIGIDSTSRLNFYRQLSNVMRVLQYKLGAIEMTGYTKVGENTFPNFVPLMTSFSEEELTKVCYPSRWVPQDKCPYIWKYFSRRNYLTAHLEDSPQMAIFNYMKTGFIRAPVDFYLRSLMLAAYRDNDNAWTVDCLGYQRPEEIILDYAVDLATLSESKGIPYFMTTWLTDLSHEEMNNVQQMDSLLANTLLRLETEGLLENTVLFVMSDHGYRFTDLRATLSGWFEDKLPAMFLKLPDKLKMKYPEWEEGLNYNSRQLTTPFDIHATLKDILDIASKPSQRKLNLSKKLQLSTKPSQSAPNFVLEHSTSSSLPLRGLSLFEKLPMRSCQEAGIPNEYCACSSPIAYTGDLKVVQEAAEEVIRKINLDLPEVCSPLKIDSVTAAALIPSNEKFPLSFETENVISNLTEFVISLTTKPGGFRFEVVLKCNNKDMRFNQVSNILRTNKKTRETKCLNDKQLWSELQCYCKEDYWWPFY